MKEKNPSRCLQLQKFPLHFSFQKIRKYSENFQNIPIDFFTKVSEYSKWFRQIPGDSERLRKIPKDSKGFREIPKDSRRFGFVKIPEDSAKFQTIPMSPKDSVRFGKIPKDSERYRPYGRLGTSFIRQYKELPTPGGFIGDFTVIFGHSLTRITEVVYGKLFYLSF